MSPAFTSYHHTKNWGSKVSEDLRIFVCFDSVRPPSEVTSGQSHSLYEVILSCALMLSFCKYFLFWHLPHFTQKECLGLTFLWHSEPPTKSRASKINRKKRPQFLALEILLFSWTLGIGHLFRYMLVRKQFETSITYFMDT